MCRGPNLLYLLCLISNTLPQLEQSSCHQSTVLHHRLLQQTTCYNHLRQLLNTSINRLVEKPEGPSAVQPTTESR